MATEVRFTSAPRTTKAVRVYTAASWADPWVEDTHLHCDYCAFTANPEMARAQFTWLYGHVRQPGGDWEVVAPRESLREFVKVEIDVEPDQVVGDASTMILWHGIIEDDNGEQSRELTDPETARTGRQVFAAYGLDIMLQRHLIRQSVAFNHAGEEVVIHRGLEFNQRFNYHGQDKTELGNRSADPGGEGAYIFVYDLGTAEYWTTIDAIHYLLKYQPPKNQIDEIEIPWEIDDGVWTNNVPDWDRPRVPCQGRTLRAVLDHLLNRSRLLGYTVKVNTNTNPETIQVVPFTFTPIDIDFDEDEFIQNIIPANANQKNLIFESDSGVTLAAIKRSTLEKMDQVVCTGDRVVACFSLQVDSVSLEKGWSTAQQTQYEQAATGMTGYGALDGSEQEAFNKAARNTHATKRVYSYFNIRSSWDGVSVIAVGGGTYTGPYFEDPDFPGQPLPFYWPDLRLLSHLPLKTDHDYSTDAIEQANAQATEVPDDTPAGQRWEYLPPMVAIKIPQISPTRYMLVNAAAASSEIAITAGGLDDGIRWSAGVRVQDEMPGIVLTVQGEPRHVMGLNDFTGLDAFEQDEATFDWETLIVTMAVHCDLYAEGKWPENLAASQVVRRMTVDLGDEYQCHYVAKGTMVDVDMADGSVRVSTTGGYIRDDRPRLRSLARLVYEWYGIERQSLELVFNYVTAKLSVGDLITTIGENTTLQTINSVVTGVKYEFSFKESTQPGTTRTTITTDFAELDAKGFSALFNA